MSDENKGAVQALKDRIAAAKAAKAEAEAPADDLAALEAAAEKLEREATDAKIVRDLQAKHGAKALRTVRTALGVVVLKKCDGFAVRYRKFMDQPSVTTSAAEELVRPCVIHPSKDEFDRIDDEFPATLQVCCQAILDLAGAHSAEISAKS